MEPTILLSFRRKGCWGFFRLKNPTASARCEPANLGTKGQHATPSQPILETGYSICKTFFSYSWFQTFPLFWMLYAFFWAIHRRLNFICRRFETLCFRRSVPKRRYIKFRRRGNTQKKSTQQSFYVNLFCTFYKRNHRKSLGRWKGGLFEMSKHNKCLDWLYRTSSDICSVLTVLLRYWNFTCWAWIFCIESMILNEHELEKCKRTSEKNNS
jgi:hypothetical protein